MNTAEIIQSKQKLEENIKSLISGFKDDLKLSDTDIGVIIHKIYMDGSVNLLCTLLDVVFTDIVNESGTDIVIR
ncbi:hypothetical protein DXA95_12430 [Odoribacter sp. OF09-27XD]|nr:hypothetical protein [Odoribacter sp. OF09-27XD]RHV92605.1 hypothetical protein DXA95_12430 [Odoribacter sp. OF09-27XD]